MSHTIKKIPVPTGWGEIILKVQGGRPSPDYMTVQEFSKATGICRKTASDTLNRMVDKGELTTTKCLFNGRLTNFYAPKK